MSPEIWLHDLKNAMAPPKRHAIEIYLCNEPKNWCDIDNENTPVDNTETLNVASLHERFRYDREKKNEMRK